MGNALRQIDFEELIKEDEIQLLVLKDYIKDKDKKITMLKIVNAILALLLVISIIFAIMTHKVNIYSTKTETVLTEINHTELNQANVPSQTNRSKNVYRHKKDK